MSSMPQHHSRENQFIALSRETPAVRVPEGLEAMLPAGTEVFLVHELGGDFTVRSWTGEMFRIEGRHADALGRQAPAQPEQAQIAADGMVSDEAVMAVLKTCYDPEIPVDIVELGLIYECVVRPAEDGGSRILIKMTLTAPGCGMGQVLADDVKRKLEAIAGVSEAQVEIVFEPAWDPSLMTEEARFRVGLF